MMRALILVLAMRAALAFECSPCECHKYDIEETVICKHAIGKVTQRQSKMIVECKRKNLTCVDLPTFNFGKNQTLRYLEVRECPSHFLRCVEQLQATGVSSLDLISVSGPLTVDDVAKLGPTVRDISIQFLYADTKIPFAALSKLPNLRILKIYGSWPRPSIKLLESWSTEIPADAFNGLSKLTTLFILFIYKLGAIGVNSFRGLDSLVTLTLDTNIPSLSPGCFSHTPKLRSVMWYSNTIQELPAGVLYNLTQLENITLDGNAVEFKLQPKSLSQLPSLKNLHLEHMKIKSLPDDLLTGNTALQKLSLQANDIATLPVTIFKDLQSLMYLDLSSNKIKKVESGLFLQLKQLVYLNLDGNSLEILPDYLFSGLTNLKEVTIEQNFLHTISPYAFQGAGIHTLSLADNHLSLAAHDQLNDTHLSHNRIKVNLRHNHITSFNMSLVEQLNKKNFSVDLRYNHKSSISQNYPEHSPEDQSHGNSSLNLPNSIIFFIENNPLYCDCGLYYTLSKTKRKGQKRVKSLISEPTFAVGDARCESPEKLKGRLVKTVSPKDFNICYLPEEDCPDDCSCEFEPPTNNLDLKCFNLPAILPVPETFGAKYLSLKLLESPQSLNSLSVDLLNLTGIGLKNIHFAPSQNVTRIDFSNNCLTSIPVEFLSANTTLYLSKNPFKCDCMHSNEIAILKKSFLINDSKYLTCSDGRSLNEVDVSTLCGAYNAAIIATGTFVVLLIIATILSITIYRNKHEVFILLSRIFPCIFTDDLTDSDKEYDIFISYAHRDVEYLRKLLPRLENDFKQKTCLHYRDWSIGDFIPEQINRSVQQSRRTIILLSKNFLESTYANMEFRVAHNYALQEGKTRVILILLEDVTDYECLSEELKAYINTNTYLCWDDPRFWERLQKALPRKNAKKFIWPEIFKRRVNQGLDVPLDTIRENL